MGMPITPPITSITRLNSTVKDLLIYLFDLSPLDVEAFFTLMKEKGPLTIDILADKLERDRTTVFRSVQKLVKQGIVMKDSRTIKDGGYYHVYSAIDKETFKLEVERKIKDIQEGFTRILKKFENDIDKVLATF